MLERCPELVERPATVLEVHVGTEQDEVLGVFEQAGAEEHRRLLELNATDLMHVAYAIEGSTIVLSAALELENLDQNELEATLSDVDLALARHIGLLREIAGA